jgi:hypothetical protein
MRGGRFRPLLLSASKKRGYMKGLGNPERNPFI